MQLSAALAGMMHHNMSNQSRRKLTDDPVLTDCSCVSYMKGRVAYTRSSSSHHPWSGRKQWASHLPTEPQEAMNEAYTAYAT